MKIFFLNWSYDYEELVVKSLKESFPEIDIIRLELTSAPKLINVLNKKLNKLIRSLNKKLTREKESFSKNRIYRLYVKWLLITKKINNDDILICRDYSLEYLNYFKCKKIMLVRNTISCAEEAKLIKNIFDKVYSFDIKDCGKYSLSFLEQFYFIGFEKCKAIKFEKIVKHKCFFLGKDKNRIEQIKKLAVFLQQENCIVDFCVVRDETSTNITDPLYSESKSYSESLSKTLEAEILIDITKDKQIGLTIRPLESIFFNKKLITNNRNIINYDFYSSDRIFILGRDDTKEFQSFLSKTISPIDDSILFKYSPDLMLKTIIEDNDY